MKDGSRQQDVIDLVSHEHGKILGRIVCAVCGNKTIGLMQSASAPDGAVVVRYFLGKHPQGTARGEKTIGPGEQRHIVILCPRHGKLACDIAADTPMGTTVRAVRPGPV